LLLRPQQDTVRSLRNPQVWNPPTVRAVTPVSPVTVTGAAQLALERTTGAARRTGAGWGAGAGAGVADVLDAAAVVQDAPAHIVKRAHAGAPPGAVMSRALFWKLSAVHEALVGE
jgi:hypothetical protein